MTQQAQQCAAPGVLTIPAAASASGPGLLALHQVAWGHVVIVLTACAIGRPPPSLAACQAKAGGCCGCGAAYGCRRRRPRRLAGRGGGHLGAKLALDPCRAGRQVKGVGRGRGRARGAATAQCRSQAQRHSKRCYACPRRSPPSHHHRCCPHPTATAAVPAMHASSATYMSPHHTALPPT